MAGRHLRHLRLFFFSLVCVCLPVLQKHFQSCADVSVREDTLEIKPCAGATTFSWMSRNQCHWILWHYSGRIIEARKANCHCEGWRRELWETDEYILEKALLAWRIVFRHSDAGNFQKCQNYKEFCVNFFLKTCHLWFSKREFFFKCYFSMLSLQNLFLLSLQIFLASVANATDMCL